MPYGAIRYTNKGCQLDLEREFFAFDEVGHGAIMGALEDRSSRYPLLWRLHDAYKNAIFHARARSRT